MATLATIFVGFLVEENWRGDRDWEAYRRHLVAHGERLDLDSYKPRKIPNDRNFCRAPAVALLLYQRRTDDLQRRKRLAETRLTNSPAVQVYRSRERNFVAVRDEMNRLTQLPEGPSESPAADVLRGLAHAGTLLDEVREAAFKRPDAALESEMSPPSDSTFAAASVFHFAQVMGLRAAAALEVGRGMEAYSDVYTLQRLANALMDHPETLMRLLVGISIHGLAADVIERGCQKHLWSEIHLREFQRQLDSARPVANLRHALGAERAHVIYLLNARPRTSVPEFAWPVWMFHGWAQQNMVSYCRDMQEKILSRVVTESERIELPSHEFTFANPSAAGVLSPFRWMPRLALPWVDKIVTSSGGIFDRLKLTNLACALERHRLEHGRFPRSLDELTPTFITASSRGTFDGEPARLSQGEDDVLQIYFLGKNRRDDGGRDDDVAMRFPVH